MNESSVSVALIWAMSRNRVIGKDNQLPWHLPNDLRHFKRTTLGAPIIMGRLTFESTGGALPGRTNIVVTSGDLGAAATGKPNAENVVLARSIDEALDTGRKQAAADGRERVFVCGGQAVYAATLPCADELFVTQVDASVEGDAFFPEFDLGDWQLSSEEAHSADDRHPFAFSFLHYTRVIPKESVQKESGAER